MNDMTMPMLSVIERHKHLVAALEYWKPQIEEAMHHGADTHSYDDVCRMVLENRVSMFTYPECFAIMEVVHHPQFSVLHCFLAGGKLEAVLEAEKPQMELAKTLGCKYMSFAGREGWMKVHKHNGWKHVCTTMYKEVI